MFIMKKKLLDYLSVLLFFLILWWLTKWDFLLIIGAALLLTFLIFPQFSVVFIKYWQKSFGYVFTWIVVALLVVIFYGVLTPLALLKRIFTKNNTGSHSSFIKRDHVFTASDFKNPF